MRCPCLTGWASQTTNQVDADGDGQRAMSRLNLKAPQPRRIGIRLCSDRIVVWGEGGGGGGVGGWPTFTLNANQKHPTKTPSTFVDALSHLEPFF